MSLASQNKVACCSQRKDYSHTEWETTTAAQHEAAHWHALNLRLPTGMYEYIYLANRPQE